jgi:hypothetical protein
VGFSFDLNVPDKPPVAPLAELAALEAVVDAFVAALLVAGANSVAVTPPVSIDPPTIAAIAKLLCRIFMTFAFLSCAADLRTPTRQWPRHLDCTFDEMKTDVSSP